jgi:hypothetical protein
VHRNTGKYLLVILLYSSHAGCGGADGPTTPGGGDGGDRAQQHDQEGGSDEGGGLDPDDGGDGESPGATGGTESVDVPTNLEVAVTQTLNPRTFPGTSLTSAGLRVTSIAWYQHPSGDDFYGEWFGTMTNEDTAVHCAPNVYIDTIDSQGTEDRAAPKSYGKTYLSPERSSGIRLCLGPGEEGAFWGNESSDTPTEFSSVEVTVTSSTSDGSEFPDADPPVVTSIAPPVSALNWLEGEVTNGDKVIEARELTFFVFNADGFLSEKSRATNLEGVDPGSYQPGATWLFRVAKGDPALEADYLMFLNYDVQAAP